MVAPATFGTRDEAIAALIIDEIESTGTASADEYDIEAIADSVLARDEHGRYGLSVDREEFWILVEENSLGSDNL